MRQSVYSKIFAFVVAGLCASCSSPGQSVQNDLSKDKVDKKALSIGIESSDTQLIVFYVINNSASDINMLAWNTPFEKILSADIFLVKRGTEEMPYLGRQVKRSEPGSDDYLLISAGQKLVSEMDIAKYYGLSEAGEYTVALNLPQIDGATKLNQETVVDIEVPTMQVVVSP